MIWVERLFVVVLGLAAALALLVVGGFFLWIIGSFFYSVVSVILG